MNHFSNKLIVKDPFEMPAVDDTTVLVLRECVDLVPHCWIWNESVGYLEVVTYSGYDIYVTVKNVGMKENATSGTIFPSCMEFLITAPNATPIIDNTVTCLRADFKCPTVGQEALMSVDSTSAIRVGDIIIVDTRYQYLVTEIINEHTMKVLNEEKGKEGGVIDVKCNECVPVKILESTHCCEALQDQVDDIYNRIDTKKSIATYVGSLVAITNGLDSLTDVANNVYIDVNPDLSYYDNTVSQFITLGDVPRGTLSSSTSLLTVTDGTNNVLDNISLSLDTDLSKYDNTTSAFITLGDVPALPSDTDLSHYDNSTSGFITSASLPTVNDATLTIYESDGVTPFVSFSANAASNVTATLPASGTNLIYFEEFFSGTTERATAMFQPNTSSGASIFYLGSPSNWFNSSYVETSTVETLRGQNNVDKIEYPSSNSIGHTVTYNAGTSSINSGRHVFKSGSATVLSITEDGETVANGDIVAIGDIVPVSDNSGWVGRNGESFEEGWINEIHTQNIFPTTGNTSINIGGDLIPSSTSEDLGSNNNKWGNAYIDNLYASNLEFNATFADFDFSTITSGANIATGATIRTSDITISNPYTHGNMVVFMVVTCNISRFRSVSNSGTTNYAGPRFQGYINRTTTSSSWVLLDYYVEHQLTTIREDNSYSLTYTFTAAIPPSTTHTYNASIVITTVGFQNGTLTIPGGTYQRGKLELLYGHIN